MSPSNLLMIPGPVEVSPAVVEACQGQPPSHVAEEFIERFGAALEMMRRVWQAGPASQPFVVAGSGTIAMDMAMANVVGPGDRALVVNTGYFSDRMADMLGRRGVVVDQVSATAGQVPPIEAIESALDARDVDALFATHVDTSTGVRIDAKACAQAADKRDVLSIFDGVCATAAEAFEMNQWGADVYLTASQKAVGLPPGLALLVFSRRALDARDALESAPPMSVDVRQWMPIMEAYQNRQASYFSTPATNLVAGLYASLREITDFEFDGHRGIDARVELHRRSAQAMRAAWSTLGLEPFAATAELAANTLSALMYPDGVDAAVLDSIQQRGVVVAGGLYPGKKQDYFRVGHMGHVTTRPDQLVRTVRAVGQALVDHGHPADVDAAAQSARHHLQR